MTRHRLSIEHIREAAALIDPAFLRSPQFECPTLSEALGVRTILKVETLNPVRSFKGRGVEYYLASRPHGSSVVTASSGNLGLAMAFGCRKRGMSLKVFAGSNASSIKIQGIRAFGADVVLAGKDFDESKEEAKRYCESVGVNLVEDGVEPRLSEGAGTIAVELLDSEIPLTDVVVALGNGAMLGGIGRWIKSQRPHIRVLGVVPRGAPCMERSWRLRAPVVLDEVHTIALGMATRVPVEDALEDLYELADDIIVVDDASMIAAMRLVHRHVGVVLEPSGAAGIAALLETRERFQGRTVATILCGGNLAPEEMSNWLGVSLSNDSTDS
jgi:threonine dehydratase